MTQLKPKFNYDDSLHVRAASADDLPSVMRIYNEGIQDRVATLDEDPKTDTEIRAWFEEHGKRYAVLVAADRASVVGWASLNRYSHRCAYAGVADLSIYVARGRRGTGVGSLLLREIERVALKNGFHKIVLFALSENEAGKRLYHARGFADVGVFREQGKIDGRFVDVLAMEKILL